MTSICLPPEGRLKKPKKQGASNKKPPVFGRG
jgi:hypothetical protein